MEVGVALFEAAFNIVGAGNKLWVGGIGIDCTPEDVKVIAVTDGGINDKAMETGFEFDGTTFALSGAAAAIGLADNFGAVDLQPGGIIATKGKGIAGGFGDIEPGGESEH